MKFLFLLTVVASSLTAPCVAYGQAGVAERILFYSNYLAEEIVGSGYTIAPGCAGSRAGGRCTFDEFIRHLWAPFPAKGDTVAPTSANALFDSDPRFDFTRAKLATIVQKFNNFKKAKLKKPLTGNIDATKLSPGSKDYYDAMRKAGGVASSLRSAIDGMPEGNDKEHAKDILNRAKESAGWDADIRAYEMDHNEINPRIKDLEKRLGFPMETKPGRDSSGRVGTYTVWDPAATCDKNPTRVDDILKEYHNWRIDPANGNSNMRHLTALQSAKMSSSGCGC